MPTLLDIGSGGAGIPLPKHFDGWEHHRLDIDPVAKPDVLLDARDLSSRPAGEYTAVYCSHNLEHYHRHEGLKVLQGMRHVCKPDAFAQIVVPDLGAVMAACVQHNLDLDDRLYQSPGGPILVRDVIFGYHVQIERNGNEFFAHRTGFTRNSLAKFVASAGFARVAVRAECAFELTAYAFCAKPKLKQLQMLGLPETLAN
jgi:hypothetical protein